jgi:hypothetical protein
MGKRVNWRPHEAELQILSDDLIEGRVSYDAIKERLASIFGPAKKILGVDARLRAFLEFLFMKSQGPYSPYFMKYSHIILMIIRRSSPLRQNLNEFGAHTIGNMILDGRGHWKFVISDFNELSSILEFWLQCGLHPPTPRSVFDAILDKNEIRFRIERLDGAVLIRLANIFPMFKDEFFPPDVDFNCLRRKEPEPFKKYYLDIIQDYYSQGKSIDDIIERENQRSGETLVYRNQFLTFLVKTRHNFRCQICVAGDPATNPSSIEVHHIIPLADRGKDHSGNMIVTCDYHHKEIHDGKIILKKENEDTIAIRSNGRLFFTDSN